MHNHSDQQMLMAETSTKVHNFFFKLSIATSCGREFRLVIPCCVKEMCVFICLDFPTLQFQWLTQASGVLSTFCPIHNFICFFDVSPPSLQQLVRATFQSTTICWCVYISQGACSLAALHEAWGHENIPSESCCFSLVWCQGSLSENLRGPPQVRALHRSCHTWSLSGAMVDMQVIQQWLRQHANVSCIDSYPKARTSALVGWGNSWNYNIHNIGCCQLWS